MRVLPISLINCNLELYDRLGRFGDVVSREEEVPVRRGDNELLDLTAPAITRQVCH